MHLLINSVHIGDQLMTLTDDGVRQS